MAAWYLKSLVAHAGFGVIFPTMDWQQLVSLLIVAGAAVALLGRKFRGQRFSFERDTHCGCAAVSRSAPQASIVYRARKGCRPEVHVKMR